MSLERVDPVQRRCTHQRISQRYARIGGVRIYEPEPQPTTVDVGRTPATQMPKGGVDELRWSCDECGEEFIPLKDATRRARGQRYVGDPAEARAKREREGSNIAGSTGKVVEGLVRKTPETYRVLGSLYEHVCDFGCDSKWAVNCNCGGRCPKHTEHVT